MLVLGRKPGEVLELTHARTGERILVVLVRSTDRGARIGIEADQAWNIRREELDSAPAVLPAEAAL